MTLPSSTLAAFTDAAADRVARLIAETRREAQREREVREAQFVAKMAELDARIASVAEIERRMGEKLATLKDGEPGKSVTVDDVLPVLTEAVERAAAERVESILASWERPKDGKSITVEDVAPMLNEAIVKLADDIREAVPKHVSEAVAAIPVPKDGEPGKDAVAPTAEEIAGLVREDIARQTIEAARAEIASWERPKDGMDYDPEKMLSAISEAVEALPKPKDGNDGVGITEIKIVDTDLVITLSDGGTFRGRVVGWDGVDCDFEKVNERIAADIKALWDTCPKPKDGEPGKDGKLPVVKAWEDRVYYEGEVVTFDGSTFQASRDTGKAPGHEDWSCIVRAGRNGEDGRSFAIRGTWDDTAVYDALDVVSLNGASFVAKVDNPGPCPGEGWQLMAAQGKRGKPGEKGIAGVGLRGLPGSPIKRAEISGDGLLRLHNGDGSTVECDLYPLLSKIGG